MLYNNLVVQFPLSIELNFCDQCGFNLYIATSFKLFLVIFQIMQQRPQDISSHILNTIREIIERSLRRNTNVVTNVRSTAITVPANYSMLQKKAILEAAHSAGLVNVHLVTDPVACILLKHITSSLVIIVPYPIIQKAQA